MAHVYADMMQIRQLGQHVADMHVLAGSHCQAINGCRRGCDDLSGSQLSLEGHDRLARLLSPQQLGGLAQAVALLIEAIRGDWSILIAGDYDCDGATGTAVAVRGLRMLGARRVDYAVPAAGGPHPGKITDLSPEAWATAFSIHVHAVFHLFRAAHAALSAKFDPLIEQWCQRHKTAMRGALAGAEAGV